MNSSRVTDKLTPSICESALEKFSASDDSLAGIIAANHIEVRDFMMLSLICDQGQLTIRQLMNALGLSLHSVIDCADRLCEGGLVEYNNGDLEVSDLASLRATAQGLTVAKRVLE